MAEKAVDWAAVEAEYRAGDLLLREIAARHGTTAGAICMRARRQEWQRAGQRGDKARAARRRAQERQRVTLGRLHRLVRRLSVELERRVAGEASTLTGPDESGSTAQILTALARAVAVLNAGEQVRLREQIVNNKTEDQAYGAMGADAAWAEVERRLARLGEETEAEGAS